MFTSTHRSDILASPKWTSNPAEGFIRTGIGVAFALFTPPGIKDQTLPIPGSAAMRPVDNIMKILTVSDVVDASLYPRADTSRFRGIDLILACGDLPPEYLSYLVGTLRVPLFFIRGNHDIRYETKPPLGSSSAHPKLIQIGGVRIVGFDGSHWYNGGPNQYTEWQMRMIVLRVLPSILRRGGVDIVMSHAPPRLVHDAEDLCHRGFQVFRWLIRYFRPQYFIHGHIHNLFNDESERITRVESTRVVNTYGFFQIDIGDCPLA